MSKIKIPSNRTFGLFFSIFFMLLWIYFRDYQFLISNVLISLFVVFFLLGISNSKILYPLNYLWFRFGNFLGMIISPVILMFIYFLTIVQIGLILKLFNRDIIGLKFNKNKSYWKIRKEEKTNMNNQF